MSARVDHRLEGFEPDNLLAFLALLGALRCLEAAEPSWLPRVAWAGLPLRPILHLRTGQEPSTIAESVAAGLAELAKDNTFEGQADLNYSTEAARGVLASVRGGSPRRAELFSALMNDAAVKEGRVEATPLCLLFGQGHQHFLDRLAAVPATASPPPRGRGKKAITVSPAESLAEALFHRWARPDESLGFRWDPEEDVRYAMMADDPSKSRTLTQHGANRLAAVGLAALTTAPAYRGDRVRLNVLGGRVERGVFSLAWPLVNEPASLSAIRALLSHPGLREPGALAHLGVTDVRVATRHSNGKFMNFSRGAPLEVDEAAAR